jgi:hypothetical protein
MRLTDVASAETLLRLVQSVPSPKAEPIKLWLAKVGYERMQEMSDPALSLERARATWQKHGRSEKWIQQRMTGQETRNLSRIPHRVLAGNPAWHYSSYTPVYAIHAPEARTARRPSVERLHRTCVSKPSSAPRPTPFASSFGQ